MREMAWKLTRFLFRQKSFYMLQYMSIIGDAVIGMLNVTIWNHPIMV